MHQQNGNRSGRYTHTTQTLQYPSPVLLSTSRCSQPPLELCNVLSDSARAISGARESTCTYGGAFRMLRDLTIRIVKFCSYWNRCAGQRETSRAAEASAQALQETWCHILTAVVLRVPQPQGKEFIIFVFCYRHKIRYSIIRHVLSQSFYIHTSWPGIPSYPRTLFQRSSTQNRALSRIPFGCHVRCGGMLMMGCLTF